MKDWLEQPTLPTEKDPFNPEEPGEGDPLRLTVLPFNTPSPLFSFPSPSSVVIAQAWTRQVLTSLLRTQIAQVLVAVDRSIEVENDFLFSGRLMALLLALASGKPGSITGLRGGLPHASVGQTDMLSLLAVKRLERETNEGS